MPDEMKKDKVSCDGFSSYGICPLHTKCQRYSWRMNGVKSRFLIAPYVKGFDCRMFKTMKDQKDANE